MKAARFYGPRDVRVEEVPMPEVSGDRVLVQVRSAGLCGTDLAVYRGDLPVRPPVIMGHECAGVVAEIGPEVQGIRPGDRVLLEPSWGCGTCVYCRRGLSLHCTRKVSLGRSADGLFAEYAAVPVGVVHPVAEHVPFDDAQVSSTLASALRALRNAQPPLGGTAAVVGSGHAGLILLQLLRLAGLPWVAMAGTREKRLALARELGADLVVEARTGDPAGAVLAATGGLGIDLAADAAATSASLDLALRMAAAGGTVLTFGIFEEPVDRFRAQEMYRKELRLVGGKGGFGAYEATARLLDRRALRIAPLVSHALPLERVAEGFRLMDEKAPEALRIVLHPGE